MSGNLIVLLEFTAFYEGFNYTVTQANTTPLPDCCATSKNMHYTEIFLIKVSEDKCKDRIALLKCAATYYLSLQCVLLEKRVRV